MKPLESVVAALVCLTLGGCASPATISSLDTPQLSFSCPDGLTTITQNAKGQRRQYDWLGADPSDPDLCIVTTPRLRREGQFERLLFGRWPTTRQNNTADEATGIHAAMTRLLNGTSPTAQFILRGRTGEQTVQQWSRRPAEVIDVDGRQTAVVPFHIDFVYGGSTATYSTDVWFDPALNVFVKSRGSLERGQEFNWSLVSLTRHKPEPRPSAMTPGDDSSIPQAE